MAALMWVIAAGIIGLIVYLSAIERIRDFAVFKATGAPNRLIVGGLMLQAVLVAVTAGILLCVWFQIASSLWLNVRARSTW